MSSSDKVLGLILVCLFYLSNAEFRVSLNSESVSWIAKNQTSNATIPAKVPGGIYTDLKAANLIPDEIFNKYNDRDLLWVSRENWTFTTDFELSGEVLDKSVINLVFHGVDTVADVILNGQQVAKLDNMFLRYIVPIKGIAEAQNHFEVRFQSPITYAQMLYEQQSQVYEVPPSCVPPESRGQCHVNHLRKMQASFSWDWGPAFPSAGIWKSVEVEAFDTAVVRDVMVRTFPNEDEGWSIAIKAFLDSTSEKPNGTIYASITLSVDKKIRRPAAVYFDEELKQYVADWTIGFGSGMISSWWPNGYGEQALYNWTISFEPDFESEPVSEKNLTVGFRTVELVQEEITPGKDGLSFYFKVNGVPIFAKGSNWIPANVLPELGYKEEYVRHLLLSAKQTHQNMLRVWGGGVYESDLFYSIADQYGILIWQDMMFACSMYPTWNEFLVSTATEVEQQMRRLQHHPSVAVWAGNNENEAALRYNWYGTDSNYSLYHADYVKLYVDNFAGIFKAQDPSRTYVVSSPSNGLVSEAEDSVAKEPFSPLYGDIHYYNYVNNAWDATQYPDTRFASEYGFQGYPSLRSMDAACDTKSSDFRDCVALRQHHPNGDTENVNLIRLNLPLPADDGSAEYFSTLVYYSQINQAMSTKTETEKYRRDRSKLTDTNLGQTMGALYWQLNDVWHAPTWASIEFGGRWKMLHYFARKFFSPVLISPEKTIAGDLNEFIVSDLLTDLPNVTSLFSIYSWDDFEPRVTAKTLFTVGNSTSKLQSSSPIADLLQQALCEPQTCFIYCSLEHDGVILSDNIVFPTSLSEVTNMQTPNIMITNVTKVNDTAILVELKTDRIAAFVWLETDVDGVFSDNGFHMLASTTEILFSNMGAAVDLGVFQSTLTVQSLASPVQQAYKPTDPLTTNLV